MSAKVKLFFIIFVVVIGFASAIFGGLKLMAPDLEIKTFYIEGQVNAEMVSEYNIDVAMPYGTDKSNLLVRSTVSPGVTIEPADSTRVSFDKSVFFTVKAGKREKKYVITVNVLPNIEAKIKDFNFKGMASTAAIGGNADDDNTVTAIAKHKTDLVELAPEIILSDGATISPASGIPQDFSQGSVTYTVTAEDGKTSEEWRVSISEANPNTKAEIKEAWLSTITDEYGRNEVNVEKREIYLTAFYGFFSDKYLKEALCIKTSAGAVYKLFGNFPGTAVCTVISEDEKTVNEWKITVVVAKPDTTIKITKVVLNNQMAAVDMVAHTIRLEVSDDISLSTVILTELDGVFGKIDPKLADGNTLNFSNGTLKFTVTAEDTTVTEKWTISVYHPYKSDLKKAVIGKGEGPEHVLIRQMSDNPVYWGYTGVLSDLSATKKWIGSEIHRIAIRTGYVSYKTGQEIRVKKIGVLYVLDKDSDGQTVVKEYAETPKNDTIDENIAAKTCQEATFAAANKEIRVKHIQKYEYVFNPIPQTEDQLSDGNTPQPVKPISFQNLPQVPVFQAFQLN
jgi:hypothetical protein